MKTIKLSVQEFALPAPRTGSIESNSGLMDAAQVGSELHRQIQKARKESEPDYQSEVKIAGEFPKEEFLFVVEGRMDGLFSREVPEIEEIKSCFNLYDLKKNLKAKHFQHPYVLQLHTYGYLYWKKFGVKPSLSLRLISSRTYEETSLHYELDIKAFEHWLEKRVEELLREARRAQKRSERRKLASTDFPFPFDSARKGQRELISFIQEGFARKTPLMVQAPTGLGKTLGVLYPAMKEALSRGQKTIYVTPKNSQQRVAEEAIEKFQEKGSPVKAMTLTAKSRMCMKPEPLCDPGFCEYALDYYDKLHQHNLKNVLMKKKRISARVLKNMAEKYKVCPFELQLEAIEEMDTVICDYNYAFSHRSVLGRAHELCLEDAGKPNLIIDEAHNLPARGMSYYSPSLSTGALEKMRLEMESLPRKFAQTGVALLDEAIKVIRDHAPVSRRSEKILLKLAPFLAVEEDLRSFLSKYLDSEVEIKSKDVVLRFVFTWTEFTDILRQVLETERSEFFVSYHFAGTEGVIKITCCDASEMLRPRYENFDQVVAFSATLKPFDYYLKLSGFPVSTQTAEFETPFSPSQRKILLIPQVSTKFSQRDKSYGRVAETIQRVCALKEGNYVAFFPSFDFLDKTFALLNPPPGFRVIRQTRYMKNDEVDEIIQLLKEEGTSTIVLAVQGGHFSEGVDYPGEMLIGAFVIGPPLPNFDFERETMKSYYQEHYREGYAYAYTYPAMAKAVQAAGRVIRTETDKGLIVLLDDRFLDPGFSQSMPSDWFERHPQELVSGSILKEVREFWESYSTK